MFPQVISLTGNPETFLSEVRLETWFWVMTRTSFLKWELPESVGNIILVYQALMQKLSIGEGGAWGKEEETLHGITKLPEHKGTQLFIQYVLICRACILYQMGVFLIGNLTFDLTLTHSLYLYVCLYLLCVLLSLLSYGCLLGGVVVVCLVRWWCIW